MAVLSYGDTEVEIEGAGWRDGDVWLPIEDLPSAVGWEMRPEGMCAGEVCVPFPPGAMWSDGTHFNLSGFARHIGLAEAADEIRGIVAYEAPRRPDRGPGTVEAPDFTLPDIDGNFHSVSDYRGQKVLLLAWASF